MRVRFRVNGNHFIVRTDKVVEGEKASQESIMLRRTNVVFFSVLSVLLVATWTMLGTAVAQKASVPKSQDKLALGEDEVKQLLLLIDTDKKGKISKQEWMKFMEAEFERLDKNKTGELDVKELAQSRLRVSHFAGVGK
jgi:EF hand domain-containing protein